jgi:hypothetical protein
MVPCSPLPANFASGLARENSTCNHPMIRIRGYERHRFQENFGRNLREKEDSNIYTATNADGMGTSGHSQTVTGNEDVTVRKSQKTRMGTGFVTV